MPEPPLDGVEDENRDESVATVKRMLVAESERNGDDLFGNVDDDNRTGSKKDDLRAELENIGFGMSDNDFKAVMSQMGDVTSLDKAVKAFERLSLSMRPQDFAKKLKVLETKEPSPRDGLGLDPAHYQNDRKDGGGPSFTSNQLESRRSVPLARQDHRQNTDWNANWGEGRYFKGRYNEMDPSLRGVKFAGDFQIRPVVHDEIVNASRRRSSPLNEKSKNRGWVQHWGEGRYFHERVRMNPAEGQTKTFTVRFKDSAASDPKTFKGRRTQSAGVGISSTGQGGAASPRKNWNAVSGKEETGNFNPPTREFSHGSAPRNRH